MLTKGDKQFIVDTVKESIKENNKVLIEEIIGLFNVTNERIDQVLDQLKDHDSDIDNHDKRIGNLEVKVFATTTST